MAGAIWLLVGHSEKHLVSLSVTLQLLVRGSHSPSGHSGHTSFRLARQNPVCKSIQLCGGGQSTISDFTSDGGVSSSGGSGLCGWASCKH